MKCTLYLISLTVFAISCAPSLGNRYVYNYNLIHPASAENMSFKDDDISVTFAITKRNIEFKLWNNTSSIIKVHWDQASLVIVDEAKRIIHGETKLAENSREQVASVLPENSFIDEVVLPSSNVSWVAATKYNDGGWRTGTLLPEYDMKKAILKEYILSLKGKTLRLYLPIEKDNRIRYYKFEFQITNVEKAPKMFAEQRSFNN